MCSLSFLLFHQLLCFFNPSLNDSWHHSPLLFFPFVILARNWHLDCSYISVEQMGSLGNHTLSITCSMRPREVLPEVSFFGFSKENCFHTFTVQSFPNLRLKLCEHINYTHTHTHTHTHTQAHAHAHAYIHIWTSLVAQLVKNLPAMQETPVRFLGWEDPLEKG